VDNYARYTAIGGDIIGEGVVTNEHFADLWKRLANVYKDYPEVGFGLMNEPYNVSTAGWVDAANAAIKAIRDTGAQNLVFINANGWSGAHSWQLAWMDEDKDKNGNGLLTNGDAMLQIEDPAGDDKLIFEAHQYFNYNYSDWGDCVGDDLGDAQMEYPNGRN